MPYFFLYYQRESCSFINSLSRMMKIDLMSILVDQSHRREVLRATYRSFEKKELASYPIHQ